MPSRGRCTSTSPATGSPRPRTTRSDTTSRPPISWSRPPRPSARPDDPATWRVARSLVDHALDWGWDETHGGFHDKGDVFAGKPYDTTKVWWTQAEGLNALLVMDRKYGATTPRYWRAFRRQWDFIEKHMIDPDHGGWYWQTTAEGTPSGEARKATEWKANYHTGRALMNVSDLLGVMVEKAE